MWSTERTDKHIKYINIILLIFLTRTIILGLVMFKGPYFIIQDTGVESFKIFFVFLDVMNIFQFIFMFGVIERKNLFQFMLYIPLLIYSLAIAITLAIGSYQVPNRVKSANLYIAIGFLYAYIGVLVIEAAIHIFMYKKLKNDFNWTNFKKVGVNPVINEAFKRREEFNAVKRFFITVFCTQLVNFIGNTKRFKYQQYTLTLISRAVILLAITIFPNEEHIWQRRFLLVSLALCILGSLVYFVVNIVLYFLKINTVGASVLESVFYMFNITILFISAFRDYQAFGSGLREYYSDNTETKKRRRLLIAR